MLKLAVLVAAVAVAGVAGEASAHARLIRSEPKIGATAPSPKALRLWFSEGVVPAKSSVRIAGAGGPVATGKFTTDPKDHRLVVVPIAAPLTPGAYQVTWSATSEDTHTIEGKFGFKVK